MSTLILTHGDCDGLCSGAIALAAHRGAKVVFTNPIGLPDDLKGSEDYDRVIVCDVAIDIGQAPVVRKMIGGFISPPREDISSV
jgi:RecJ-like exonuclease